MKPLLLLEFLTLALSLSAQNFTEYPASPPFEGLFGSSIAFSDVNGDGTSDVLITGGSCPLVSIAKLYINDGTGNFTEMADTPFEGVSYGSVAFGDVNGDGSSDVLITGYNISSAPIAKLYTNDGAGIFTEMPGTPFEGVGSSSVAFSDVNGDGTSDILITGLDNSDTPIAKLYTNDGASTFTEMPGTPFEGVGSSSIAFSDVNGDGTSDVLITGYNSSSDPIAKLYTNDGTGTFTEMQDTPFEGQFGPVAFSDVNGDSTSDVLLGGYGIKLFTNDGSGNFSEVMDTPLFFGVNQSSIAFADVNGDGISDVLITGTDLLIGDAHTKLFTNDGMGGFSEVMDTPFIGVRESSIAFADVNGDDASDVLIIGSAAPWFASNPIAKLFFNDGMGNFSEKPSPPFKDIAGSIAISDINGDGTSDVLISGRISFFGSMTKLYTNDGNGNFSELPDTPIEGEFSGSVAFADVDGDGTSDFFIAGGETKLYTNNGSGDFSEVMGTPFEGVYNSSIAFSDVEGDGDEDVLITGSGISKLYINNGSGDFSEVMGTPFEGVYDSSIAFSDVNGDGSSDVLISGEDSSQTPIAKLYTNDGSGTFTEIPDTPFEGVSSSSIAFSDINGDGDEDVLITGQDSSQNPMAKLYTNGGSGDFSEMPDTPFEGVSNSSIAFSDVDGDGASDVLITGQNSSGTPIAKMYINDGTGSFSEIMDTPFIGVTGSSIAFSDVNGDGNSDVLISGESCSYALITKLYINEGTVNSTSKWRAEENPFALIYPNPNTWDKFFVDYESAEHSELQISLYDLSGRLLKQYKRGVSAGLNSVPIEPLGLPKGMYLIKLDDSSMHITTLKLIIQ